MSEKEFFSNSAFGKQQRLTLDCNNLKIKYEKYKKKYRVLRAQKDKLVQEVLELMKRKEVAESELGQIQETTSNFR